MSAEQIVQQNLEFYNLRNIDGFVSCLSEQIELYSLGASQPTLVGISEARAFYAELFDNSPELHSSILKRIVIGNKVIDHEHIVGRNGSREVVELVLIYEVKTDKISKITVIPA